MQKQKVKVKILIVGSICFVNLEKPLSLKGVRGKNFVQKLRRKLITQDIKYSFIKDFIFTPQLPNKQTGKILELEIEWEERPKGFLLGEVIKLTSSKK